MITSNPYQQVHCLQTLAPRWSAAGMYLSPIVNNEDIDQLQDMYLRPIVNNEDIDQLQACT